MRSESLKMDEVWKEIHGTTYKVSSFGNVLGPRKLLKLRTNTHGYPIVCIWRTDGTRFTRTVHKIVSETFLGPCPEGLERNHVDGNKLNNRADNLEYITRSNNQIHSLKNHLSPSGEKHYKAKLTLEQVNAISASKQSERWLGRMYGVAPSTIGRIRNGLSWKHYRRRAQEVK